MDGCRKNLPLAATSFPLVEWNDISDRDSLLFDGTFIDEPSVTDALRQMLNFVRTRFIGFGNAESFDLLLLEVGLDTGRMILALTTSDAHTLGRADGCSLRLQSLQDAWYDADDAGLTDDAFTDTVAEAIRNVGTVFLDILPDSLPDMLAGSSNDGFTFTLYGGDRGVSLMNQRFPRSSGG